MVNSTIIPNTVQLPNFFYIELFGPLTCFLSATNQEPTKPYGNLESPTDNVDIYVFRQNQIFYMYSDAQTYGPILSFCK